jgi:tRNA-splicing endonuclease subunit Sen2
MPSTPDPDLNVDQDDEVGTDPFPFLNGTDLLTPPKTPAMNSPRHSPDIDTRTPKRRKNVRFSPNVESTTFQLSDPPSPHVGSLSSGKMPNGVSTNGALPLPQSADMIPIEPLDIPTPAESLVAASDLVDREHLQLSPEEAFYLTFALGALAITDSATRKVMSVQELFPLFCQLSRFPLNTAALTPDDPFLVQYAVYHHFRSLGWVVRSGIKFGVDWLLYIGGPVFSHAEFAVVVLPAYTDPYWTSLGRRPPQRSWHWLHSINRVQSHALKTMVIVYVDIPPPTQALDPSTLLKRYTIREFFMKRWLSNRSR